MRPAQELPIFSHLRDPDSLGKQQEIWPTPSFTPGSVPVESSQLLHKLWA